MAEGEWVWLARIRRPQGRKGEVLAEILTDFPEKFAQRRHLWLLGDPSARPAPSSSAPRAVELTAHWLHKGAVVLHFAGIDSISDAETLNGLIVAIPGAQRATLGEDEVFIGDLIGCVLIDTTPALPLRVGVVEDVDRDAGPVALLVVRGERGEILVPFAKSYLRTLDLEKKCIEMVLPEGLCDLNEPGSR